MNAFTSDVEGLADGVLARAWRGAVQRLGGVGFVATAPHAAADQLVQAAIEPDRRRGEHVHLANAYSIALSSTDPDVASVFDDVRGWLLPDGRPLAWLSALRRDADRLRQVRGPQLMLDVADRGRTEGLRHYLLGGSPEVLIALQSNLESRYPGIEIVGAVSPPFRAPTLQELAERDQAILASGADIVWVGLGTPKQDFEAARLAAALPVVTVAVGAAFDYAAGALRAAPHWISVAGLEWLWRLVAEPRRLWRRYTIGNARFLHAVARNEAARRREHRLVRRQQRRSAAVVVGQLPPPLHGSAVMTQRLIEALHDLGRPVAVVDRRFSRSVTEVGAVGLRKLLAVPSLVLRFARAASGRGPVIVLVTTRPTTFLLDVLLLAIARRPAVLYVHTVGFRRLAARGALWSGLVRRTLGRASRIVVLGPSLVDDVAAFVEPGRVEMIANCTPDVVPSDHVPGARLLFLSNLMPGKGADAFVRLGHALRAARPDVAWRFDIAGAGDPALLPALADGTEVHGRVEGARKDELLRSADLLVLPSTYAMEAQPLVVVEALSYGLPVVAYDNGGIRDLVDPTTGALVPRGDEAGLVDAVLDLVVHEPEWLQQMRRVAARRHRERHSLSAYRDAWRGVLGLPDPSDEPDLAVAPAHLPNLRLSGPA